MSLFGAVRGALGDRKDKSEAIEGTLVDNPKLVDGDGAAGRILVFHLDSRPDLEFREVDRPLVTKHRRGDRVKVHCRLAGNGVADVDWMEMVA